MKLLLKDITRNSKNLSVLAVFLVLISGDVILDHAETTKAVHVKNERHKGNLLHTSSLSPLLLT